MALALKKVLIESTLLESSTQRLLGCSKVRQMLLFYSAMSASRTDSTRFLEYKLFLGEVG